MLVLNREDLKNLLEISEVIEAVERGFREHQEGYSITPTRMQINIPSVEGTYLVMPSYLEKTKAFGSKIVSVYPRNIKQGKPTINSAYLLCDSENGEFISLMDGGFLTGIRTGAVSALASKYLARPDASTLGIIGTGQQAQYQVAAICAVRPIDKIVAYDVMEDILNKFVEQTPKVLNIPTIKKMSSAQVVREADILVTVTTSSSPVFKYSDIKDRCHINAVGAFTPQMQEIESQLLQNSLVVVDTYEGCLKEAGDILIPIRKGEFSKTKIHAELGEIVLGLKPGSTHDNQITLFKSVGVAFEDLVTAKLAFNKALQLGIGMKCDLD